jgi:hypothetical protein
MSECCSSHVTADSYPKLHNCPVNGKPYHRVERRTILHHVSNPWARSIPEQGFYFCTDPECDVVYFGQDNSVIRSDSLRTSVWQKAGLEDSTFCYCFGVTRKQARADNTIKAFIIEQTRNATCACETLNPSGRCCLGDFPAE